MFVLKDWRLEASFFLLLGVHGVASSTGVYGWQYFQLQYQDSPGLIHQDPPSSAWGNNWKQGRWKSMVLSSGKSHDELNRPPRSCSIDEKSSNPVPERQPGPISAYSWISRLISNEQIKPQWVKLSFGVISWFLLQPQRKTHHHSNRSAGLPAITFLRYLLLFWKPDGFLHMPGSL